MKTSFLSLFTVLALTFLLISLPQAHASGIGLGLRGVWNGIRRSFEKDDQTSPQISIKYPSGAVKDYVWSAVKPFLWSYVCRLCAHVPERCQGDTTACRPTRKRLRHRDFPQEWKRR